MIGAAWRINLTFTFQTDDVFQITLIVRSYRSLRDGLAAMHISQAFHARLPSLRPSGTTFDSLLLKPYRNPRRSAQGADLDAVDFGFDAKSRLAYQRTNSERTILIFDL